MAQVKRTRKRKEKKNIDEAFKKIEDRYNSKEYEAFLNIGTAVASVSLYSKPLNGIVSNDAIILSALLVAEPFSLVLLEQQTTIRLNIAMIRE